MIRKNLTKYLLMMPRTVRLCISFCPIFADAGPRSNYEIGGGGGGAPLVNRYWGGEGARHLFLLTLYNLKNIGGGHVAPCPPAPWSLFRSVY